MKCEKCGYGPMHGVSLFRQNAKGIPGIWRCERCLDPNKLPPDDVAQTVAELEQIGRANAEGEKS